MWEAGEREGGRLGLGRGLGLDTGLDTGLGIGLGRASDERHPAAESERVERITVRRRGR